MRDRCEGEKGEGRNGETQGVIFRIIIYTYVLLL